MKNWKQAFIGFLVIIVFLVSFTACDNEVNNDEGKDTYNGTEGLSFLLNTDGTYYVFSYGGTSKVVNIPSSYKGKPVTKIGGGSEIFQHKNITSVTIPASITEISRSAFRSCSELTTVTFADGSQLKTINNNAFQECTSLPNITIPESVTKIGDGAFYLSTSITTITIPASVTSVGQWVFGGWTASQTIYVSWTKGNRPSGWNAGWNDIVGKAQVVYLEQ